MASPDVAPSTQHRINNFCAWVEPQTERLEEFPDEAVLCITWNGFQSTRLSLSKAEAAKVVIALANHFGEDILPELL